MKKSSILLIILSSTFFSCSDNRERNAQEALASMVTQQSEGNIALKSFKKTDGIEKEISGTKVYEIEWNADVTFLKDAYKPINKVEGSWSSFGVYSQLPKAGWNSYLAGQLKMFFQGAEINLTGSSTMIKSDNGWRVEETKVKDSKVLSSIGDNNSDFIRFLKSANKIVAEKGTEDRKKQEYYYTDSLMASQQAQQATQDAMQDSARMARH